MAQNQNGHLPIEQLSALLDKQLSAQEVAQAEAHLRDCQQCQGMLNDLSQTVALLHALPQPVVPRSFVLSPEMLRATTPSQEPAKPVTIQLEERRQSRRTPKGSLARRSVLPRTMQVMCTLVALLGFIFLLSAIPSIPRASSTTSSASNGSTTAAPATSTMAPNHVGVKPATQSEGTRSVKNSTATHQSSSTSSPATAPATMQWPGFLDPFTPGGRVIDGLILLVLALLGLVIASRWRRGVRAI
ncbi:MAG TPA: zf-HC2 domain-containing protein [Ktedonobacteraceae bacterium]|nr:zf-HC2 domain-containing protein [Ktedonobacteraceae bacterium]